MHTSNPCPYANATKRPDFPDHIPEPKGIIRSHLIELVSKEKEDGNCIEAESPKGSRSSIAGS